jgi:RNA polymerase sigma-70 factor (ECF subfamily)
VSDGLVSRELIAACRKGDERAFGELVEITHRRVFSLAVRLVGNRFDAEDVAQDAYLRMFRGLSGFREEARFETWMYRIVTNSAINLLRRRGRGGELLSEDAVMEIAAPDAPAEQTADRDELAKALDVLPAGQRAVVILKDVYGLSCREIGDELGIEEGAVKVRLHRARKRLKETIQQQAGGGGGSSDAR